MENFIQLGSNYMFFGYNFVDINKIVLKMPIYNTETKTMMEKNTTLIGLVTKYISYINIIYMQKQKHRSFPNYLKRLQRALMKDLLVLLKFKSWGLESQ